MAFSKIEMPLRWGISILLAEREGFEPPDLLQSTVFKTAAFDRSAISPRQKYISTRNKQKNNPKNFYKFLKLKACLHPKLTK
jgi:hypothetical protein